MCDCPSCERGRWLSEAYMSSKTKVPDLTQNEKENLDKSIMETWYADDGRREYYSKIDGVE